MVDLVMPIRPLYGHEGIRNRLAGAVASGRLPQALLFEGPRGVGKQRLALWLGQLLLCESPVEGKPCDACRSCRLAVSLQHPDLHWFVPLELNKKGADADKQIDLVEEALAEEMAARREGPLYDAPSGLASHGIASVRLLLRRLALTPAMGSRKVFIVGDAERLVAQQGADAAANALLKALEEPPADTLFILTAAEPEALLPTVLSRVVRVRVTRVQGSVVTSFIQSELQGRKTGAPIAEMVAAADGRIGKLLAQNDTQRQGGSVQAAESFLAQRMTFALRQTPYQARGAFTDMLDALLERLRARVRERGAGDSGKLVEAIAHVLEARTRAQGNVNPQLLAAVLSQDLAETA
jgi:DNA polymerase III subunit delta'